MKLYSKLFILSFFLNSFYSHAQTLDINNHADCDQMLTIETKKIVGPTTAPNGHGEHLEFSNNSKEDVHFMENENHSVWYKFSSKTSGTLSFELEPLDSLNDYDFALYKYTGENFCAEVLDKKLLPIRTNFSRNKPEMGSKTGLRKTAEQDFVGAGINPAYSKTIPVQKGETFVLLVNNVYKNGDGHILHFGYVSNRQSSKEPLVIRKRPKRATTYTEQPGDSMAFNLGGEILDENNQAIGNANVTVTDTKTGNILAETTTDSVTGRYNLSFKMLQTQRADPIHLAVSKDGYFFKDTLLIPYKIAHQMHKTPLNMKIKKLKKGDKFVVGNILFHGDSPMPLDRAMPTIKALLKTMKRNKTLKISIEGHTNGCHKSKAFSQKLSHARAQTVHNFLIDNKIAQDRVAFIGYDCQFLLHDTRGPLAYLNRRVEIEIVDL